MQARIIKTSFWSDPRVENLSKDGALLYAYCLTNPYIGMTGAFEISEKRIQYETKLTQKEFDKAKRELQIEKLVIFKSSWVVVLNTEKQNNYANGAKTGPAYQKELVALPDDVKGILSGQYPIDTLSEKENRVSGSSDTPRIHKSEIINQKPENEGGVGETTFRTITSLTDQVCFEIARHYKVTPRDVMDTREELELYCRSKNRKYSDYKATLMTWVRTKVKEGKLRELKKPMRIEEDA